MGTGEGHHGGHGRTDRQAGLGAGPQCSGLVVVQQRTRRSLYQPSPWCGGEENWKKKAKLVGWDKGSLTELLPREGVESPSLGIFKTRLDKVLCGVL